MSLCNSRHSWHVVATATTTTRTRLPPCSFSWTPSMRPHHYPTIITRNFSAKYRRSAAVASPPLSKSKRGIDSSSPSSSSTSRPARIISNSWLSDDVSPWWIRGIIASLVFLCGVGGYQGYQILVRAQLEHELQEVFTLLLQKVDQDLQQCHDDPKQRQELFKLKEAYVMIFQLLMQQMQQPTPGPIEDKIRKVVEDIFGEDVSLWPEPIILLFFSEDADVIGNDRRHAVGSRRRDEHNDELSSQGGYTAQYSQRLEEIFAKPREYGTQPPPKKPSYRGDR